MPRSLCGTCVVLALLVPASVGNVVASRAVTAVDSSASVAVSIAPPASPRFRLGDAARPFGWSTAIGDVNTDGTLDVAVADHVGQWASEYLYRIELSISGQATPDVTFESTHDAVSIRLSDVDRDNDLDIVVGVPLSAETVGVWLNDGHGHFTASDLRQLPASLQAQQTLDAGHAFADLDAFEPAPRRADLCLPFAGRAPPSLTAHGIAAADSRPLFSPLAVLPVSPRGPPTASIA